MSARTAAWWAVAVAVAMIATMAVVPRCARADSDGDVTFGTKWWTQDHPEAKFREFRDIPNGPLLESFFLRQWEGPRQFAVFGSNAIRHDQHLGLSLAQGVRWRLDGSYREIPHLFSLIARTPYVERAPGILVLPDSLQRTNQENPGAFVPTMTDLLSNAPRIGLSFRTDVSKARLRGRPAHGWQFELTGTRRERSGRKPYGGTFGLSSAVEIFEPIDQRMLDGEAKASYERDRMRVEASAGLSEFDNSVSTLRWDNPKRLTDRAGSISAGDGSSAGQLDLYPDNNTVRGNLALGLRLPRETALTATFGVLRGEQNDPWLPFTINSAIPQSSLDSLPGTSTDAKAVRWIQDTRLTSRIASGVRGTLRFHYHDYDNQTPEHTFIGQAIADQAWTPGAVTNRAFGNRQVTYGGDVDMELWEPLDFRVTVERRHREHTHREVEKDDENAIGTHARLSPMDWLSFEAGYEYADRKLDEFHIEDYEDDAGVLIEQPGLRRFDVADRFRNQATAGVSLELGPRLDVDGQFEFGQDRYPGSVYGLHITIERSALAEATYHLTNRVDVSGGYGRGRNNIDQRSNESGHAPPVSSDVATNWAANIRERNDFAFARLAWQVRPRRLTISADYFFSRALTEFHLNNTAGTARDLPNTFYRRHEATLEARYRAFDRTELSARYGLDLYYITDFASENIPLLGLASGSATAIYLGDSSQDYRAHQVTILATRRF